VQNEKISIEKPKNLKSKDPEMWRITEIIECCKYFHEQELEAQDDGKVFMVTLLTTDFDTNTTGSTNEVPSSEIKKLENMSQKENIDIQNIVSFYDDWKYYLNKT
jgi:hypothetical protein